VIQGEADEAARRGRGGREEKRGGWAVREPPEAKAVQERGRKETEGREEESTEVEEEGDKDDDSDEAVGRRGGRGRRGRGRKGGGGGNFVVGEGWRKGGGGEKGFGIVGGEGDGDGAWLVDGADVKGGRAGRQGEGQGAFPSQADRGLVCPLVYGWGVVLLVVVVLEA